MSGLDWDGFLGNKTPSVKGNVTTAPSQPPVEKAPSGLDWDSFLKTDSAPKQETPAAPSWWAAADSAVNSAGMNIPRNIGAGVRSLVTGNSFDDEYAKLKRYSDTAAEAHPVASGAGAVAGYGAMAMIAPELLPVRAGLVAKGVQGAVTGGTISGVSELADSHDVNKAIDAAKTGAVVGGFASPIVETIGSGLANAVSRKFYKPKTTEMLREDADAAYSAARDAGLVLKGDGVQRLSNDIELTLKSNGYHPKLQPKAAVVLEEVSNLWQGNVTLDGLDNLRKIANTLRMDSDPSTRKMGGLAISKIDDFLEKLNPSQIASGHGPEAVKAIQDARGLWSSFRKSEVIDDILTKARQNADGGNGNLEQAIKNGFKSLLQSKSRSAGFTLQEKTAMARVVSGSDPQKIARLLGRFAPNGGLLGTLTMGASFFTPKGAILSAVGGVAKSASQKATEANVERLSNIVRSGKSGDVVNDEAALAARQFLTSVGVNVDKISGLPPEKLAEYFPQVKY